MQLWEWISIISIIFSLPVIVTSYYQLILFVSALLYPLDLEKETPELTEFPSVSILIACYNEKNVIGESLDAITTLDYPFSKINVVIADDSDDETRLIVDDCATKLEKSGIKTIISRRDERINFKSEVEWFSNLYRDTMKGDAFVRVAVEVKEISEEAVKAL